MKYAVLFLIFSTPFFSQAIECFGDSTYLTSNSEQDYSWTAFKVGMDSANFYSANLTDGSCNFSINYSTVNGDTYYVSVSDSEANVSTSGLAAFDSKGRLSFNLIKGGASVCAMKCNK